MFKVQCGHTGKHHSDTCFFVHLAYVNKQVFLLVHHDGRYFSPGFYYLLIFYLFAYSSEISQEFVERSMTLLNGTKESEQSL